MQKSSQARSVDSDRVLSAASYVSNEVVDAGYCMIEIVKWLQTITINCRTYIFSNTRQISLSHFRVSGFRFGACRVKVFQLTT